MIKKDRNNNSYSDSLTININLILNMKFIEICYIKEYSLEDV